jgi:hypothetical protein
MVEKLITSPENVVDFARYQKGRSDVGRALAAPVRACRHCGATLLEGEREDECSSASNLEAPLRGGPRKFYAE